MWLQAETNTMWIFGAENLLIANFFCLGEVPLGDSALRLPPSGESHLNFSSFIWAQIVLHYSYSTGE